MMSLQVQSMLVVSKEGLSGYLKARKTLLEQAGEVCFQKASIKAHEEYKSICREVLSRLSEINRVLLHLALESQERFTRSACTAMLCLANTITVNERGEPLVWMQVLNEGEAKMKEFVLVPMKVEEAFYRSQLRLAEPMKALELNKIGKNY